MIQTGDRQSGQNEVIGQEYIRQAGLRGAKTNAKQRFVILPGGQWIIDDDHLIVTRYGRPIDRTGRAASEIGVALAA